MTDHAHAAVDMLAAVTSHRASLATAGAMEPNRYKGHIDAIELDLKSAHVLAMLAVAEQTRLANLIASRNLLSVRRPDESDMHGSESDYQQLRKYQDEWDSFEPLRAQIREGLGVA